MANLIWVYNGPVPNFTEKRMQLKFGPCYQVFRTVNEIYPQHKCFLMVNASTYGEVDAHAHSAAVVQAWRAAKERFIHVPIVVLDLARLGGDADPILYESEMLCTREVRANMAAIFNALVENNLIKPFILTFMRGVLDGGHHVAKAIVSKELLAIVARYIFGGCTADSSLVAHIVGREDIRNMRGTPQAYARLDETDPNEIVAKTIGDFLTSLDGERRSGAPTVYYDRGGFPFPNLTYLIWHHFPQCFDLDFRVHGNPLCDRNHKILTFADLTTWQTLYAFLRSKAEYAAMTERDIQQMFIIPYMTNNIEIFFNFAPQAAYLGTLWAILEFTRKAPTNRQEDGTHLSTYNRLMGRSAKPPMVTELAWHINSDPTPPVIASLFPLPPGIDSRAYYLTDALYFPTFTRQIPEQCDSSWTPTGCLGIRVLFRNNGMPTALAKLVSIEWYRQPGKEDPLVSPRGERSRKYPALEPL